MTTSASHIMRKYYRPFWCYIMKIVMFVCQRVWLSQSGKGQWFILKKEAHVTQPCMVQSAPNFAYLIIVLKMSTCQYYVKVSLKLHFSSLLKTAPVGFLLKGVTVVWWQISVFLQETGSCCNSTAHGQNCPSPGVLSPGLMSIFSYSQSAAEWQQVTRFFYCSSYFF